MKKILLVFMRFHLLVFMLHSVQTQACEILTYNVVNCLTTQSWETNESLDVKVVCAGIPFKVFLSCSQGGSTTNSVICVYKIIDGVEEQIKCLPIGEFTFTPEEGITYRIGEENGNPAYGATFIAVECLEIETSQNNGYGCDQLFENQSIEFTIPIIDFDISCYVVDWDFGDGTVLNYNQFEAEHQYDLNFDDPCQRCETFIVTATLNNILCDDECPTLIHEQEITVCRETIFSTGHEEELILCYGADCLTVGEFPDGKPDCYYDGFTFEWSIQDDNQVLHTFYGLEQTLCPPPPQGSTNTLTMTDPFGCTFTKNLTVAYTNPPEIIHSYQVICNGTQPIDYLAIDCNGTLEYDPEYYPYPITSNIDLTTRCYDEDGCLSSVYVHHVILEIPQACVDPIADLCEGEDLVVGGSCSDAHDRHQWEIYEAPGAWEERELLWSQFYTENENNGNSNQAGSINLSEESGIELEGGKCYYVILTVSDECEGQYTWSMDVKYFCVNPKPPCFGGEDVYLNTCQESCVVIGLDVYNDLLTHEWNDGSQEVSRTVCPEMTTSYILTTTNEFGCVCIDTVTVFIAVQLESSEFPICFDQMDLIDDSGDCGLEICVDVQINTGQNCDCEYSVTQLCQEIPEDESICFDLDMLDLPPENENYCVKTTGIHVTLGNNYTFISEDFLYNTIYFSPWDLHYLNDGPCSYQGLFITVLADGTLRLQRGYFTGLLESDISSTEDPIGMFEKMGIVSDNKTNTSNIQSRILTVFPNPVSDQLIINIENNAEILDLSLFNTEGRKVKHIQSSELTRTQEIYKFDVSSLKAGWYVLQLKTRNGITSKKIVVFH